MTRSNPIKFSDTSTVNNIPEAILKVVPDEKGVLFRSEFFAESTPQPDSFDDVLQIDEARKAEGKEPTSLEEKVEKCFPVGSIWKRSEFEACLRIISSKYNFDWRCDSNRYFKCLKTGSKRTTSKKAKEDIISVKSDCPWIISVSNLWSFPKRNLKSKGRATWSKDNPSEKEKKDMFIRIKSIPTEPHNHPLDVETYQQTVQKCGVFGRELNSNSLAVRSCLLFRHRRGNLPNNVIQAFCEESTPNFVCWDSEKCNNFRKKIERLHASMSPQEYASQSNFEANFMSKRIQDMFNDDSGDAKYTDVVSKIALKELLKFYSDSFEEQSPDTQKSKIQAWFDQLRTVDSCFDYKMMKNEQGKITGIVWMTGQMRRDLEENGGYVMLDFMKKEKNIHLFPYASVVMFRASGQLCLGSEALFFTESTLTYKFLCDATFKMAHERSKESVNVIAGDEFLDQDKVTNKLGFTNARFIFDQFHLIKVNLAKKLSASGVFQKLENAIYEWVNADSEQLFQKAYKSLLFQMKELHCTSSQESAIQELEAKKDYFAAYKLRSYKGTLRRKGNSGSESNHASVASHLDSKSLLEIPTMQAMLAERQRHWNHKMMRLYEKEEREIVRLIKKGVEHPILKAAISCVDGKSLCLTGYEMFREQFKLSLDLEMIDEDSEGNMTFDDGVICRMGVACPCEFRQADLIQCCHEIKRSQGFDISAFDRRYHFHNRPWDRRIERNNYHSDGLIANTMDNQVETQEGTSLFSHQSLTDDDQSLVGLKLDYQGILQICKDTAHSISNNQDYSFKKEAVGLIIAIGEIAKNGVKDYLSTTPGEFLRSFIDCQSENMNSSMMIDPSRKSKDYHPLKNRPLFHSEVMSGKGSKKKRKSLTKVNDEDTVVKVTKPDPKCKFCNGPHCTNKKAASKCPKLLGYGGILITRNNDTTKNEQNERFVDDLRKGKICPSSSRTRAPAGLLAGNKNAKFSRHVIIHSVHKREGYNDHAYEFDVLVTTLDSSGDKNIHYTNVLIDGTEFINFANSRAMARFIIDRRHLDSPNAAPRQQQPLPATSQPSNVLYHLDSSNAAPRQQQPLPTTSQPSNVLYTPAYQGLLPPDEGYLMNYSQGNMFGMSQGYTNGYFPLSQQPVQSQLPQYTNQYSQQLPYAMSQNNTMHHDQMTLNEHHGKTRDCQEDQEDED